MAGSFVRGTNIPVVGSASEPQRHHVLDGKEVKEGGLFPELRERPEGKTVFSSGAQSSGQLPRYDLIPRALLDRLAQRYTLGAEKYGDYNYRKGFSDEAFVRDRINHLQNHLQAYLQPKTEEEILDDNLSAIAWAVAFLMERETWLASNLFVDTVRDTSYTKLDGEGK